MKRKFCVGLGFVVAAVISCAADTSNVIVNAKIESASASVWYDPAVYKMKASCTFSINTRAIRVKQPILKLIICYELGDGVRYFTEQYSGTYEKKWGWCHHYNYGIEAASKLNTDVESSLLRRVIVKSEKSEMLYVVPFVDKGSKVLAVRAELWFDGNMLCNYSPQNKFDLLKLALPEDWYIKDKYPDRIKYCR